MSDATVIPAPPRLLLDSLFNPSDDLTNIALFKGSDTCRISTPTSPHDSRPFVTLTFAQSLDAKIAGKAGKQLILSGKESMVMTHWMRTMHDAIMVGIGTALNDNPQLNTRYLPPLPPDHPHKYHLPRPVILDTNLRFSVQSKLMANYKAGNGRRPYVVGASPENGDTEEWKKRRDVLEAAGVRVIEVSREQGRVSISALLKALKDQGIRSLMVEGGASVIRSFLAESQSPSRVVDRVIVTVAPTFVGADGVGYNADISSTKTTKLVPVGTDTFGGDAVLSMKFV